MVASCSPRLPSSLQTAKEQIVSRARRDRDGAFWSLPPTYRSQGETFESSLGFRTAGVLLSLLEVDQFEPDRETQTLLVDGAAWLTTQLKRRGFKHGFGRGYEN